MAINRLNKTFVDGEVWDAADINPISSKVDEVIDQVNYNTDEIVAARNGEASLNDRINNAETSAWSAAAAALNYLNDFKGRYYGAYSSDPTTDPLGNPIDVGDVYYNTTENTLKYWTGSTWAYWNQNADTDADTDADTNAYTLRRVDLTNATSDYMLQVGEEAYISFSDTTVVPLRIATQSGTYYECHLVCSEPGGTSGGVTSGIYLHPNNTTYRDAFVHAFAYRLEPDLYSDYATYSAFRCGRTFASSAFYITNFVQYKNVKGFYNVYGYTETFPALYVFSTDWRDTTTAWTSLGTIDFPQNTSGYIIVRRLV